ncbi:hypothetical protein [Lysinibacillus xylanilyticus]|uniref:hypothetical protein n=1 Tax=Lysinibacillus xylanilyticus TaxID=582475 RepID=UPI0038129B2B
MKYKLSKKFFNGKIHLNNLENEIHPIFKKDNVIFDTNKLLFKNDALREVLDTQNKMNKLIHSDPLKEIMDTQIELNKLRQSGTLEKLFSFNDEFFSAMSQFTSNLNPFMDFAHELNNKINDMLKPLIDFGNLFNNDFTDIIEELPEYEIRIVTNMLHIINQAEESQWFLDFDLINEFLEMNPSDILPIFNEEFTISYIEKNFDSYILEIKNCESFKNHQGIFDESILNYKDGRIKTAIMPLFAMFDNVFTLWCKKGLNDKRKKEYIAKLWTKVDAFQNMHDRTLTSRIMYLPILIIIKAYKSLFDTRHSNSTLLNRNAILHGSYDYELINKISYLKMIVILKELTYLEAVSYKEIEEYHT